MARRLAASARWTWASAVLALLAGGFLSWQVWQGDGDDGRIARSVPPPHAAGEAGDEAEKGETTYEMPPSEDFAEVIERPLFDKSRRPAEAATSSADGDDAPQENAATGVVLNGVLLTPRRRLALLRFDDNPKPMHVAEGQEAGGWLVVSVGPDKVILRRGEVSNEIKLDYRRPETRERQKEEAGGGTQRSGAVVRSTATSARPQAPPRPGAPATYGAMPRHPGSPEQPDAVPPDDQLQDDEPTE
ncbi:MAG: hypothetical protein IPK66_09740 [Rhodospirillales bacterium]|nr:hypothetical protein [Rhodospirillales bacterium]